MGRGGERGGQVKKKKKKMVWEMGERACERECKRNEKPMVVQGLSACSCSLLDFCKILASLSESILVNQQRCDIGPIRSHFIVCRPCQT